MPNEHHKPRRHHIPRARYKVENWPEYDRGLVERGDIRFWISEDALEGWIAPSRTTPGGQCKFSNLAIETTLVLETVFKLPLRQTEGFVGSLMAPLKQNLPVPNHTTLARRRRTVGVDQHAPGRAAPVDLVMDSIG
ncbi:MAG: transposase, partial [Pseudomonadota bacterium]